MISKLIRFTVAPASAAFFQSVLQEVEKASAAESGCVHYSAFVNKENAGEFTVLEVWDGEDSFEAHRSSAHIADFKSRCGEMITSKISVELDPLI